MRTNRPITYRIPMPGCGLSMRENLDMSFAKYTLDKKERHDIVVSVWKAFIMECMNDPMTYSIPAIVTTAIENAAFDYGIYMGVLDMERCSSLGLTGDAVRTVRDELMVVYADVVSRGLKVIDVGKSFRVVRLYLEEL